MTTEEAVETPTSTAVTEEQSLASYRAARSSEPAAAEAPTNSEAPAQAETKIVEEAEASKVEQAPEGTADEEAKPKGKGGFQKRIDKLTQQVRTLQEQLASKETVKPAEETKPAVTTQGKPRLEDFSTYEDYTEALTEWKMDLKLAKLQEDQAKQRQQKEAESKTLTWNQRVESARSKYEDFDEVALDPDIPVSAAMAEVIQDSEAGPDLAYFLGQNPVEAARIATLSPIAAARELGKIEAKLTPAPDTKPKPAATPKPKPVTPLAGKTAPTIDLNSDSISLREYRKLREANS